MTLNVAKIYIIHYNKLVERKQYLINYFNSKNINNYEFRNLYQRENLTPELTKQYFSLNNLNSSQICITIEHIETYKEIIKNAKDDNEWYLILEDDAIFCHNFEEELNKYLENIPHDAEYLDICDYFIIKSPDMWVRQNATRTNCSYLINKKTCEKLLTTIIPFEKAIDHELNKQFQIHNIKTYWSNKSFVHHGSGTSYNGSYIQFK
jgi:hypothetical protein